MTPSAIPAAGPVNATANAAVELAATAMEDPMAMTATALFPCSTKVAPTLFFDMEPNLLLAEWATLRNVETLICAGFLYFEKRSGFAGMGST